MVCGSTVPKRLQKGSPNGVRNGQGFDQNLFGEAPGVFAKTTRRTSSKLKRKGCQDGPQKATIIDFKGKVGPPGAPESIPGPFGINFAPCWDDFKSIFGTVLDHCWTHWWYLSYVFLEGMFLISFAIWIVYRKVAFVFSVTLLQENLADLMPHLLSFLKLPLRPSASRRSLRQGA